VDDALLPRVLQKANSGAAPGLSGLTADVLGTLARDGECFSGLKEIIKDIINGNLDDNVS